MADRMRVTSLIGCTPGTVVGSSVTVREIRRQSGGSRRGPSGCLPEAGGKAAVGSGRHAIQWAAGTGLQPGLTDCRPGRRVAPGASSEAKRRARTGRWRPTVASGNSEKKRGRLSRGGNRPAYRGDWIRTSDLLNPILEVEVSPARRIHQVQAFWRLMDSTYHTFYADYSRNPAVFPHFSGFSLPNPARAL